MMLYLTGASSSLTKSSEAIQKDPAKSLGGFISSTPVPNGELNSLFDLISSYTLEKRNKETIALGLINTFSQKVQNVKLKIVTEKDGLASFKVAISSVSDYYFEHIANRYSEPLSVQFYDATFQRASVDIQVNTPAIATEEIALSPFDVSFVVETGGIEGTWRAFEKAFENNNTFTIKRISENIFRITRQDETILDSAVECSYLSTDSFNATFLGNFSNGVTNEIVLDDILSKGALGIWIQRDLKNVYYKTNEELIDDYKAKILNSQIEDVEVVISYDLVEET